MIKPKAVSRLFSLRLSGFSLFKRSVSFLPDALVISLSFFVFETIGIIRSSKGSISTSLGYSTSTTLFSLNLSIDKSPPNSMSLCRCGAFFMVPILSKSLRRIMTILPHMSPPRLHPYLSIAYVFMQLHEQKFPDV